MTEYKVLKHFTIGTLKLEAGQTVIIEPYDPPNNNFAQPAAIIKIKHYPEKNQLVTQKAALNLIDSDRIEE